MGPVVRDRLIEFNRNVNQQTKSWQRFRTPRFWSEKKDAIKSAQSHERSGGEPTEAFWEELKNNFEAVHRTYDEQGLAEDMERFDEVFPPNLDVRAYANRFSEGHAIAGNTLEEALSLGNWRLAREGHQAMYDQALQRGQYREAAEHLAKAFTLDHEADHPGSMSPSQVDALREFLEEQADMRRIYEDSIPVPVLADFLRKLDKCIKTAGVSYPWPSLDKMDHVATIIELGAEGNATEENEDEVEEFFQEMSEIAPMHLRVPPGYWREIFHAARLRRTQRTQFWRDVDPTNRGNRGQDETFSKAGSDPASPPAMQLIMESIARAYMESIADATVQAG